MGLVTGPDGGFSVAIGEAAGLLRSQPLHVSIVGPKETFSQPPAGGASRQSVPEWRIFLQPQPEDA
jgi:hypothetical protein